jgi:CxxC motif-containing protein
MNENVQAQKGAVTNGEFTCVRCPAGCLIEAELTEGSPPKLKSFSGNRCDKGKDWIRQEIEHPMRTITTSLPVRNGNFRSVSLRTTGAIPREKIFEVMETVRALGTLSAPLCIGQAVIKNPAGTNTDVIVTRNVENKERQNG